MPANCLVGLVGKYAMQMKSWVTFCVVRNITSQTDDFAQLFKRAPLVFMLGEIVVTKLHAQGPAKRIEPSRLEIRLGYKSFEPL